MLKSIRRRSVQTYETQALPNLKGSLESMEQLFSQAATDVLKVIDVRRKLLLARGGYLDALYELRQASNDLAAAVADPALTLAD